jgi:hypothetical protein
MLSDPAQPFTTLWGEMILEGLGSWALTFLAAYNCSQEVCPRD